MSKPKDLVETSSNDSFPASDPPSWTPVTGTGSPHVTKVLDIGGQLIVHVADKRGQELRDHLAAYGISAKVSEAAETPFERLEIDDDDADIEDVQRIVDQWVEA